jgi:hypothetical protein
VDNFEAIAVTLMRDQMLVAPHRLRKWPESGKAAVLADMAIIPGAMNFSRSGTIAGAEQGAHQEDCSQVPHEVLRACLSKPEHSEWRGQARNRTLVRGSTTGRIS